MESPSRRVTETVLTAPASANPIRSVGNYNETEVYPARDAVEAPRPVYLPESCRTSDLASLRPIRANLVMIID